MNKTKSIVMLTLVIALFAVLFCFNASAAEWNNFTNIAYTFDEDTGVMVVRGDNATIDEHFFGRFSSWCHYRECECIDFFYDYDEEDEYESALAKLEYRADKTKILIFEGSIEFEEGALSGLDNIETIILPDSLEIIERALCYNLPKLKTVVLPSGLKEIRQEAFAGCDKLLNITIPSSVKRIERNALYCSNADRFIIPDTVEFVGEGNKNTPDCLESVTATPHSGYVSFSWKQVNDASHYRVFVREGNKWKKVEDVEKRKTYDTNVAIVRNLKNLTKYTFAVRPYNKVGDKIYWAPKYVKVTATTLLEKTDVKTASTKNGAVKIIWDDIGGEQGYQVWYSTKSYSGYKKYSNYKANVTQATVAKLTSGKTYYFKVRSYLKTDSGYVYSDWSNVKSLKVK